MRDGEALGAFELPLIGEYNIRNALAALATAAHAGLAPDRLQPALARFAGVKRRQEEVGHVRDILLIDDFAHHPTAVAQTLAGLARAHPHRRLLAVFEPASATNARALFEDRYVDAFAPATAIVVAKVPRPERARSDEPFSPTRLVDRLAATGKTARYIPDTEAIADHLASAARPGDLIAFLSNGGFGGLQRKLLARLENAT